MDISRDSQLSERSQRLLDRNIIKDRSTQWRIQDFCKGGAAAGHRWRKGSVVWGHHGECGAQAYKGDLGAELPAGSRGRAVRESGGEAPLKLKAFCSLDVQRSRQI